MSTLNRFFLFHLQNAKPNSIKIPLTKSVKTGDSLIGTIKRLQKKIIPLNKTQLTPFLIFTFIYRHQIENFNSFVSPLIQLNNSSDFTWSFNHLHLYGTLIYNIHSLHCSKKESIINFHLHDYLTNKSHSK